MGSSRASTPAGRRRTAQRASATKAPARKRSAAKPKPPRASGKPSKPARSAAKPRAAKPKPKRSATAKPKATSRPSRPVWVYGVVLAAFVGCLAAGYFLWFQDSSFAAVEEVSVQGIEGPEQAAVTAALEEAAAGTSTLAVDESALAAAVARFSTVAGVAADGNFPHGLTVTVTDRPPTLVATDGERSLAIAADGTTLPGVDTGELSLPSVELGDLPASGRLEGDALRVAVVAGAAPDPLRPLIEDVVVDRAESVEATLRGGIPVLFGDGSRVSEKWAAVAAVLADPKVKTLTQIDVRVPERPSIGGAARPVDPSEVTEPTIPVVPAP